MANEIEMSPVRSTAATLRGIPHRDMATRATEYSRDITVGEFEVRVKALFDRLTGSNEDWARYQDAKAAWMKAFQSGAPRREQIAVLEEHLRPVADKHAEAMAAQVCQETMAFEPSGV